MAMSRILIGLSVGSGLEGVDAAAVRLGGVGLNLTTEVLDAVRITFPPSVRDLLRLDLGKLSPSSTANNDLIRNIAETAIHGARQVLTRVAISPRDTFATAFLEPGHSGIELPISWSNVAVRIAEQTGLTVFHGFRYRDRAAGGAGNPITSAADYLVLRSATANRLLIHLGAVTYLLQVAPNSRVSGAIGFEAGPGNQLLDSLIYHGTRGKERYDPGGKTAVQGRCLEPLLARWLEHPHLTRTPPKSVHPEAFGRSFLLAAFDATRQLGAGLPDLLCTATHLIAHVLMEAARQWLPESPTPRQILISGGGVRNGFLWQLVGQQFGSEPIARSNEAGLPALARNAVAAGILAALTCDGVDGNLPHLTGAAGGRLLGQLIPGDGRNWARVAAWVADQAGEYPRTNRVA